MTITPSQSQSILHRHATEIASLRLSELCHDDDRTTGMVTVCNSDDGNGDHLLLVDFSRQRMTQDTINHLLRLSTSLHLRERIKDLAWGRLAPGTTNHRRQIMRQSSSWENQGPISPTISFAQELDDKRGIYAGDDIERGGSMHLSLRMPANRGMSVADPYSQSRKNALDEIHTQWKQINALSLQIREGNHRGGAGLPLVDVLLVSGSTVVPSALEFVRRALMQDETASRAVWVNSSLVTADPSSSNAPTKNNVEALLQNIVKTPFKSGIGGQSNTFRQSLRKRKLKILTSVDPTAFAEAVCDLNPSTTCVITLAIDESVEEECKRVTMLARSWLLNSSGAEIHHEIVKTQMYLVTINEGIKRSNPNNAFLIPRHSRCEAFSSFSAAGLLPLSLLFGWDIVSSFVAGGHSMDRHFVETNPRHNMAVLCALVDVWNDAFLKMHGRVVKPYLTALGNYASFVSALEDIVLSGKLGGNGDWSLGRKGKDKCRPSSVIDGGSQSTSKYGGGQTLSTEFVTALDPGSTMLDMSTISNNDDRICAMFHHADMLAFGSSNSNSRSAANSGLMSPGSPPAIQSCDSMLSVSSGVNGVGGSNSDSVGNHPSMLIICGRCDAFACGQLIALTEHRVLVKAWLWGIDPFELPNHNPTENTVKEGLNQMYQELSIRGTLSEDEDDRKPDNGDAAMNISTRMILKNYATRMQKYRDNSTGTNA